IGVGVSTDGSGTRYSVIVARFPYLAAPDGSRVGIHVGVTATEIDAVRFIGIDGDREVVITLAATLIGWQDIRHASDACPPAVDRIETVEPLQNARATCRDEGVQDAWIARADAERDTPRIGGETGPGNGPALSPIVGVKHAR